METPRRRNGLILALVSVVTVLALTAIGTDLNGVFGDVSTALGAA